MHYSIYRNGREIATTVQPTYTDDNVEKGETYLYYVVAKDSDGNKSDISSIVQLKFEDLVPPTVPLSVTGNVYGGSVELSWQPSQDNFQVKGYIVTRDGTEICTTPNLSYINTGLTAGQTYIYTIKAYDESGNVSDASESLTITAKQAEDTTPPTIPSYVTGSVYGSSIQLNWAPSLDDSGTITYRISRNGVEIAQITDTKYTDFSIQQGNSYSYFIQAYDESGNLSAASETLNFTIESARDTIPPSIPLNVTGSVYGNSIQLNWDPSLDDSDTVAYSIFRDGVEIAQTAHTKYTDTGIHQGNTYAYFIKAYDATGNKSANSNVVQLTIKAATTEVKTSNEGPFQSGVNDPAVLEVSESMLRQADAGKVTIVLGKEKSRVVLPANAAPILGENKLVIRTQGAEIQVPVAELLQAGGLSDDHQLIITLNHVEVRTPFPLASSVFGLDLKFKGLDGKEQRMETFAKSIKMDLSVDTSKVNQDLIGVYRYNTLTQSWDYIRNKFDKTNKESIFEADASGLYAAMEFDKDFIDVPVSHWVHTTLKIMSAKHFASGLTDNEFKPDALTTRAEFTALLVRILGLEPTIKKASFTDIKERDWYAPEVATAFSAGIINGKSQVLFDPNGILTREQMASMLMNAYELSGRKILESDLFQSYKDSKEVSNWAEQNVSKAIASGIMLGKADGEFKPQESTSRAEAVQAIYNLYQRLE